MPVSPARREDVEVEQTERLVWPKQERRSSQTPGSWKGGERPRGYDLSVENSATNYSGSGGQIHFEPFRRVRFAHLRVFIITLDLQSMVQVQHRHQFAVWA